MNAIYRNLIIGLGVAALLGGSLYFFLLPHTTQLSANAMPPSLDRPYVITIAMPDDAKTTLQKNVQEITKNLRDNSQDFEEWLNLGLHYKIAGDFQGAKGVWEYVAQSGPTDTQYIALGNLGNLYLYSLKDYPKAEDAYKQAIALKPNEISFYRDLYTLYHYAYKTGTGADAAILEQGLKANPGDKDLLELQNELKGGK